MEKQNIKVAVDSIVFGYTNNILHILLIKQKYGLLKGKWVLPGGFVHTNESLQDAVVRELKEETGINSNYLEQLYTFGDDINRDPRARVISVTYFALVNSTKLNPKANTDAKEAKWFPIYKIPSLGYDHNEIVKIALQRLKSKLIYQPIGFDLLPKEFAFSDLEDIYCTVLEKEIDRRNFRKKILSFGIIEKTKKISLKKSGRPALLFQFNKKKYKELQKKGFHFEVK